MQNRPDTYFEDNYTQPTSPSGHRLSHEERRARRRRRQRMRRIRNTAIAAAVLFLVGMFFLFTDRQQAEEPMPSQPEAVQPVSTPVLPPEPVEEAPSRGLQMTEQTAAISDAFPSEFAVLADLDSGEIVAEKNSDVMINPASMTKILTLLVAVEQISDPNASFTMTFDITDYCYVNECSVVGYEVGDVIPVDELFYGCILSSGADASLALAQVAAGSHEAFVDLMNEKLEELGLSETSHFTNCVGLYDEDHYCTVQDMALMLKAALENEKCREVLSTKVFTTSPTEKYPNGQDLSNWFIRRIEDEDTGNARVFCGKTGYVSQSGFCAASCAEAENGKNYLCVTGNSNSTWQSIYDHAELFKTYL